VSELGIAEGYMYDNVAGYTHFSQLRCVSSVLLCVRLLVSEQDSEKKIPDRFNPQIEPRRMTARKIGSHVIK